MAELESALPRLNRGRPENEQLRFSYGIGYGDVLDLDEDMFGLEVNLASKLGEDLAEPGEALLTPSAAAAVSAATLKRLTPHTVVTFGTPVDPGAAPEAPDPRPAGPDADPAPRDTLTRSTPGRRRCRLR